MTPKQEWEQTADKPLEVEQVRWIFVDGVGDLMAIVTRFDDNDVWFMITRESKGEIRLGYDMPGMNFIGDCVETEELADVTPTNPA